MSYRGKYQPYQDPAGSHVVSISFRSKKRAIIVAIGVAVTLLALLSALFMAGAKFAQGSAMVNATLTDETQNQLPEQTLLSGAEVCIAPEEPNEITTLGYDAIRMNQDFTADNGLSSRYHVYNADLVSSMKPIGLVLYFHGDGAYEFLNPDSTQYFAGDDGMVTAARQAGMLFVPVLAPHENKVRWWGEDYGDEDDTANAKYVRDLLETEIYPMYNIDRSNIWLTGFSGGGGFLTDTFIPQQSDVIEGGGAVIFASGEVYPSNKYKPFSDSLKSNFPMHFYTGLDDVVTDGGSYRPLDSARMGAKYYTNQGFKVTTEFPAGVDHFPLPFGRVLGERLPTSQ